MCMGLRCTLVWVGQDKQLGLRDVTVSQDKSLGSMSIGFRGTTSRGVFWGWDRLTLLVRFTPSAEVWASISFKGSMSGKQMLQSAMVSAIQCLPPIMTNLTVAACAPFQDLR